MTYICCLLYIYIYTHIVVNIIQPISIIQMEQIQTFDVLILGGPKSGKKRFAERLTKDIYNENAAYNQNLGVETCERESIVDGIKVMVNITVCSGRKRHLPIVQQFYNKIHAAIIMYDCSNVDSFRKEMIFGTMKLKEHFPMLLFS